MRKIKEVLRLRNELKLDQRQIARSCSISVSTVHEYLKRAEAAKVGWPLPEGWDDARLEAALFPPVGSPPQPSTQKSPPDFAAIHEQLQRHRHVTLQLLWDEYRDTRAGATMPICDRDTGAVWQASLFVAALGASSYTWAEVTRPADGVVAAGACACFGTLGRRALAGGSRQHHDGSHQGLPL